MHTNYKIILITIILFFSSVVFTQDNTAEDILGGKLFSMDSPRPLLENWDILGIFGTDGLDANTSLYPLFKKELFGKSPSGHLFVISTSGKFLAVIKSSPQAVWAGNGKIYTLQKEFNKDKGYVNEPYRIFIYNKRLKLEKSFPVPGLYSHYANSNLCVTDDGKICISFAYVSGRHLFEHGIMTYDSNGNHISFIENVLPMALVPKGNNFLSFTRDETPFKATEYSTDGAEISTFTMPETENRPNLTNMSTTLDGNLIASFSLYPDQFAFEFTKTGELIKKYNFYSSSGAEITKFKSVAKTASDSIFAITPSPSGYKLSRFDSQGNLVENLVKAKDLQPAPLPGFKRPEKLTEICRGPGRTLLGVSYHSNKVFQFNTNGKVLTSFKMRDEEYSWITEIRMNSKEEIHILCNDKIQVYDLKGKFLREIKTSGDYIFQNAKGMEIDSKDNIYVIRGWEDSENYQIVVLDPTGKPLKQRLKKNGADYPYFEDSAMDSEENIYCLLSSGRIRKYSKKGKLLDSFQANTYARSISVSASGNIYICSHFDSLLQVFNSKHKEVYKITDFHLFRDAIKAFEGPTGRVYVTQYYGSTKIINSLTEYQTEEQTATISGVHKPVSPLDIYHNYSSDVIWLEGTDKNGKHFSAIATVDEKRKYKFEGVPFGSRVSLWANPPVSGILQYKKPLANFTVKKANHKFAFRYKAIPSEQMAVHGRVVYNSGAPVHGALVQAGNYSAVTNIDGYFHLPVTAKSVQTITLTKQGMEFEQSPRKVRVRNADVIFVDFVEK